MAHFSTMVLRRRGLVVKLVVALPALWLLLSLFTLHDSKIEEEKDTAETIPHKSLKVNNS